MRRSARRTDLRVGAFDVDVDPCGSRCMRRTVDTVLVHCDPLRHPRSRPTHYGTVARLSAVSFLSVVVRMVAPMPARAGPCAGSCRHSISARRSRNRHVFGTLYAAVPAGSARSRPPRSVSLPRASATISAPPRRSCRPACRCRHTRRRRRGPRATASTSFG